MFKYVILRWQIYHHEIRVLSQQVKHLMLAAILILGVALPALFYMLLVGIGAFLDSSNSFAEAVILAMIMLVIQTLTLTIVRIAVTANHFHLFTTSLNPHVLTRRLVTCFLSMYSSPFWVLLLITLLSIDVNHWPDAAHGFALASMLGVMSWSVITSPQASLANLLGILCCALFVHVAMGSETVTHKVVVWLAACHGFILLSGVLLNRFTVPYQLTTRPNVNLWLNFAFCHQHTLLIANLAFLLLLSIFFYMSLMLTAYNTVTMLLGMQCIVLVCCALQLTVNRQIDEHPLFYRQYFYSDKNKPLRFLIATTCLTIYLVTAVALSHYILASMPLFQVIVACFTFFIWVFVAKTSQRYLILNWVLCTAVGLVAA